MTDTVAGAAKYAADRKVLDGRQPRLGIGRRVVVGRAAFDARIGPPIPAAR